MKNIKEIIEKKKRGLGAASAETRRKVGKLGGNAPHRSRGAKKGTFKKKTLMKKSVL